MKRINMLISDVKSFDVIGKPEALKHQLKWSRRIDNEHVYAVTEKSIRIMYCRFHY